MDNYTLALIGYLALGLLITLIWGLYKTLKH